MSNAGGGEDDAFTKDVLFPSSLHFSFSSVCLCSRTHPPGGALFAQSCNAKLFNYPLPLVQLRPSSGSKVKVRICYHVVSVTSRQWLFTVGYLIFLFIISCDCGHISSDYSTLSESLAGILSVFWPVLLLLCFKLIFSTAPLCSVLTMS